MTHPIEADASGPAAPADLVPRSGRQFALSAHGYTADVASIGASLRTLRFEGRDLVVPFEADEVRPGYRGVTLAPWPNRIVDGRYAFAGVSHQLPLTEPARGHALHGLAAWLDFTPRIVETDRVVLAAVVEPQAGYPFRVEVEVEYRLDADGLTQTVTGRNLGADAAPWGTGPHPYLVAGPGRVDDWTLELPAESVLTVTADRLSPVAVEPVEVHPEFDFRTPRAIADTFIDHAFTGLVAAEASSAPVASDAASLYRVVLTAPGGTGVEMTWDAACPWVQVHTADTPGADATHRIGLAVEPMTCPPDAFNSGVDLVVLEPGAAHAASWRITAR
ncbi:aldose 1-epimerase family protein [Agromyces endophyticus]|uniref:aldose 1-epimerase family protein n=1 Tax=Agromyces sp. H17E-10 TaxID=2932244 RepID=UPI001FCFA00F|nr:aldose 1-epimerase family protein [Agromyces sp. H17E-10]UOQ90544.1 aldose 1-epimerase family protein [Agromyces sp. H17E-10]